LLEFGKIVKWSPFCVVILKEKVNDRHHNQAGERS